MTSRFLRGVCPALACLATGVLGASAIAAEKGSRASELAAGVSTYSAPGGQTYFAVALKARGLESHATPRDHVVLVDTSASQAGDHRVQSLAVVKNFLASVPATDRVALIAVDVDAERLSAGFVAPTGDAAVAALAKLNDRAPLGATNLLGGLKSALALATAEHPTSMVYIGDGMSVANLIQRPALAELLDELRGRQIAVHSYAVGPRTDVQLLGLLAQQTGGTVRCDSADAKLDNPTHVARELAA